MHARRVVFVWLHFFPVLTTHCALRPFARWLHRCASAALTCVPGIHRCLEVGASCNADTDCSPTEHCSKCFSTAGGQGTHHPPPPPPAAAAGALGWRRGGISPVLVFALVLLALLLSHAPPPPLSACALTVSLLTLQAFVCGFQQKAKRVSRTAQQTGACVACSSCERRQK